MGFFMMFSNDELGYVEATVMGACQVCTSILCPHPQLLSQTWERGQDFRFPFSQTWEKRLGDEGLQR